MLTQLNEVPLSIALSLFKIAWSQHAVIKHVVRILSILGFKFHVDSQSPPKSDQQASLTLITAHDIQGLFRSSPKLALEEFEPFA